MYTSLLFNPRARWSWVVNNTRRLFYPWENTVAIAQKAGWASGPVWLDDANPIPHWYSDPCLVQPVASDVYN